MAEISVPLESPSSTPTAPARRRSSTNKSPSDAAAGSEDSAVRGNRAVRPLPRVGTSKPQRPSVPPRVHLSDHKPDPKPLTVHSSVYHSSSVGSSGATVRQNKSKDLQQGNQKEYTRSRADSYKRHGQPAPAQVSRPTAKQPNDTKYSRRSVNKHTGDFNKSATSQSPEHATRPGGKQSSTKPKPPPRPALTPRVMKGMTVSHPPPSRPPHLPNAAALSHSSCRTKAATYSHMYGSTKSLPGTDALVTKRRNELLTLTHGHLDNKKQSDLSNSLGRYDRLQALQLHGTMPRTAVNRDSRSVSQSSASNPQGGKNDKTQTPRGSERKQTSSFQVNSAAIIKSSGSVSPTKKTVSPTRKTTLNSKPIPPKRPAQPPSARKTIPSSPPTIAKSALSSSSNSVSDTSPFTKLTYDEHIYMDPQIGYVMDTQCHSESSRSGAEPEYPYVLMTPCEAMHIYTALSSNTADELEDYELVSSPRHTTQGMSTALDSETVANASPELRLAASDELYINIAEHLRDEVGDSAQQLDSEDNKAVLQLQLGGENGHQSAQPAPKEGESIEDAYTFNHLAQPLVGEGTTKDEQSTKHEGVDHSAQPMKSQDTKEKESAKQLDSDGESNRSDKNLEGENEIISDSVQQQLESEYDHLTRQFLKGEDGQPAQQIDGKGDHSTLQLKGGEDDHFAQQLDSKNNHSAEQLKDEDDQSSEPVGIKNDLSAQQLDSRDSHMVVQIDGGDHHLDHELKLEDEDDSSDQQLEDTRNQSDQLNLDSKDDESHLRLKGEGDQSDQQLKDAAESDQSARQLESECDQQKEQLIMKIEVGVKMHPQENRYSQDNMKDCSYFEPTKTETNGVELSRSIDTDNPVDDDRDERDLQSSEEYYNIIISRNDDSKNKCVINNS